MESSVGVGAGLTNLIADGMRSNRSHNVAVPESIKASQVPSWSEAITRLGGEGGRADLQRGLRPENLRELLQLQYDLSRYHLRVEVLSKVAESAVASIRKLQQNQ